MIAFTSSGHARGRPQPRVGLFERMLRVSGWPCAVRLSLRTKSLETCSRRACRPFRRQPLSRKSVIREAVQIRAASAKARFHQGGRIRPSSLRRPDQNRLNHANAARKERSPCFSDDDRAPRLRTMRSGINQQRIVDRVLRFAYRRIAMSVSAKSK